jgi:hypothetical protein
MLCSLVKAKRFGLLKNPDMGREISAGRYYTKPEDKGALSIEKVRILRNCS